MIATTSNIKLAKWAVFGVVIALVPIYFGMMVIFIKSQSFNFVEVIGNGELLMINAVMCAIAIGEMTGPQTTCRLRKIISMGATILILLLSAFLFAYVTDLRESSAGYSIENKNIVAELSLFFFLFGTIASGCCTWLSEN